MREYYLAKEVKNEFAVHAGMLSGYVDDSCRFIGCESERLLTNKVKAESN